jgi:fructose-bisphosphate aldolase class I
MKSQCAVSPTDRSATVATLESTVQALVTPGKGILAADESLPTITKRLTAQNIPSTEETRRAYRELLFTTPALAECISGAILFDETLRQKTSAGISFPSFLARNGIVPGIKVDRGTINLPGFPGEKITMGLDGLRERLAEYREVGAQFTKWRATFLIGDRSPSAACLAANARSLAVFAAMSQEADLVPIVEPEVLMDGTHGMERCEEVMAVTLRRVFDALSEHRVILEWMILKTSMVLPGLLSHEHVDVTGIAEATLRCLRRHVPAAVPGIVFLSGGQIDRDATARLNAICRTTGAPWPLSFSFGRALQSRPLVLWKGRAENVRAAQEALQHRAQCNRAAVRGSYSAAVEATPAVAAEPIARSA